MAQLTELRKNRGALKRRLTNFETLLNSKEEPDYSLTTEDAVIIDRRLVAIEGVLDAFYVIQDAIDALIEDVRIEDEENERRVFEDNYFQITAKAILMKGAFDTNSLSNHASQRGSLSTPASNPVYDSGSGVPNFQHIQLPKIHLPTFSGAHDQWLEFRDKYVSLIHTRTNIADIDKFHYLRASLVGEASICLHAIELSDANYERAWQLVRSRYDNKRVLLHNHIKSIFGIEAMNAESGSKLRYIVDNLTKNLHALDSLKGSGNLFDCLLIYIIATKLDSTTAREWEESIKNDKFPTLNEFQAFLQARCNLLSTLELNRNVDKVAKQNKWRPVYKPTNAYSKPQQFNVNAASSPSNISSFVKCPVCKQNHYIRNCPDFLKLDVVQRKARIEAANCCTNCLRYGHNVNSCNFSLCRVCNQKHHTLLHTHSNASRSSAATADLQAQSSTTHVVTSDTDDLIATQASAISNHSTILLSTALINIKDSSNQTHTIRALLDSGSQANFITTSLVTKLNLPCVPINATIVGIFQSRNHVPMKCEAHISSRHSGFKTNSDCLVVPQITGFVPSTYVNTASWQMHIPDNLHLADPSFNMPGPVDMLIGAEMFYTLLSIGQVPLGPNLPLLQKSKFGWIISGRVDMNVRTNQLRCNISQTQLTDETNLTRFWEIEEVPERTPNFSDDLDEHFRKTATRDVDGRFTVDIPYRDLHLLGDSFEQARKRFLNQERKLSRDAFLSTQYHAFMSEYIQLGHMSKVPSATSYTKCFYLPHHAVQNEQSTSTKLRVVFDGSANSSTGISINDCQTVGPVLQDDLFSILLRFRKYKYVITADVAKMYRQVLVNPAQRPFQLILWRADPMQPIDTYQLNTVTYGTASASYLAIRCLHELAEQYESKCPNAAQRIKRDFYVDDLITGADSIHDAKLLCKSINTALESGCFPLRKWLSNEKAVLEDIDDESHRLMFDFGANEQSKTLGLLWNPTLDYLFFRIDFQASSKVTKRSILSIISQIFDPLGLLTATTVVAKMLLQKLWAANLAWDESIPHNLHAEWLNFKNSLQHLNTLRIPRHAINKSGAKIDMHGFSDASERAYGACIYLRCTDCTGNITTHLLAAKSKVAPLKIITIPRLELCAALLLARLIHKVDSSFQLQCDSVTLWTDSTIVLCWLKTPHANLKQFVYNRILEIHNLATDVSWRYVPSQENPADLLSRGVSPADIGQCTLWWHGPQYLCKHKDYWPASTYNVPNLPELKLQACTSMCVSTKEPIMDFKNYSSFRKIESILAYIKRFITNCRIKSINERLDKHISLQERECARKEIIKHIQGVHFHQEISALNKGKEISSKSRILALATFLDTDGILRVGGRLQNSKCAFDAKHQILLPHKNHITELIFKQEHIRNLHIGPLGLLNMVRNKYWPIAGRDIAKRIVRTCIICFRAKPRSCIPQMGQLPAPRVTPAPIFYHCGTDYAGPVLIKSSHLRGTRSIKAWIVVFICMCTKAVHIELVSTLSTQGFISALRRFVSRRGRPGHVYSDNGSNYVGANRELKELFEYIRNSRDALQAAAASDEITWHFIPPRSPHFGGLWEAGVKSIKHHLKRITNGQLLTFEELYTLLTQIEAIMNSRPLTTLSTDPNDLSPLTPAHLLCGKSLKTIPDVNYIENVSVSRLNRYQHIQMMRQHFWKRWSSDYLNLLQQRTKWKQDTRQGQPKIGTLVLLKDENIPSMQWKLGRISEIHPGKDSIVRAVTIRTKDNSIRRAIHQVCPLPSWEEDQMKISHALSA